MSVISHRPPYNKNIVSKFVSRLFMKLLTVFHISKIVLLETTQECIPGWPPGMRSWETSRNTLLDRFWEPTLALSLNVRYLYIGINANVNLSSIFWWTITFQKYFIMGGGVECLLFHTVPPSTKTWCQNFFLTLSWGSRQFLIFQKLCSWKQPRNAFLDDIQERAPGRPPGTRVLI